MDSLTTASGQELRGIVLKRRFPTWVPGNWQGARRCGSRGLVPAFRNKAQGQQILCLSGDQTGRRWTGAWERQKHREADRGWHSSAHLCQERCPRLPPGGGAAAATTLGEVCCVLRVLPGPPPPNPGCPCFRDPAPSPLQGPTPGALPKQSMTGLQVRWAPWLSPLACPPPPGTGGPRTR